MGWGASHLADFSGYQMEFIFLYALFFITAIWVFYDADHYFIGFKRHVFWILTILGGPVGFVLYLVFRRREV